jgi:hypothetical protein
LNTEKFKNPENILLLTIFIIILFLSFDQIKNFDIWWQLKTGEIIYATGQIPKKEIFSYTRPGEIWTNHEWLSQLIFYLSYKRSGLFGIIILKMAVLFTSFIIISKRNRLLLNGYSNVFSMILIIMISHVSWLSRPVIFSFLFIPLTLYLLDLYLLRDMQKIWLIPFVMLIWVNLHGSYIIGLLLILLYTFNAIFYDRGNGVYLTKIFAASLITTLVNPNTYKILLYPLQYATFSVHSKYIVEWQSPTFHTFSAFEGALLLSLLVLAFSKSVSPLDLILILLFTHLGLFAFRNTALYALVAVPIISKYTQPLAQNLIELIKIPQQSLENFTISFSMAFLILGAGLFGYTSLIDSPLAEGGSVIDRNLIPIEATEYLLENQESLSQYNMFNNYGWGGYLIWRLYPTYKVFIDGRADVYGNFIEEYQMVKTLNPEAPRILEKYNVSLVVIKKGGPLDVYLKEKQNWKELYSDHISVIYLKQTESEEVNER